MRSHTALLQAIGLLVPAVFASNLFSEPNRLTCADASVHSVPAQMIGASGTMSPHQLLYSLRQVLCTKECGKPDNLPDGVAWSTGSKTPGDCEVSVAIQGDVEAVSWIYGFLLSFLEKNSSWRRWRRLEK